VLTEAARTAARESSM